MNLSLKLRVILNLTILLLALSLPVFAQENNGAQSVPFSDAPYKIGEHLTYDVSFSNFLSVAHVDVQVVSHGLYAGRDSLQLRAHAETTGVVNVALFSINNDYITYIDPTTGLPFHSQETVRDATRSNDFSLDLNQPAGTDAIPPRQRSFPGTYDFLSAFYRVRALPLAPGSVYTLSVRGESQNYEVEIKVAGAEVVKTNVGSFPSIATQVKVSGNSPFKSARVYFSDDERHVPVLITARISTGELRIELAGSEFIRPAPVASASPTPPVVVATPAPTPKPNPSPVQPVGPIDWPFAIGEQLNYQVFLGNSNVPVGIATFQIKGRSRYFDRDGLYLTVTAKTTEAAARIFVANDTIESYVDPKSLLPYRTVMNLVEGKRRLNQTLTTNQDYGVVTTDKGQRIEIPIGTHDYVSVFYVGRTFNLAPPKRNAVSVLVENKPKTLFISSLRRETIELGQQKVPAIALSLTTDDPEPDKFRFRVWISNDRRRLPLRMTCQTVLGPLRADLAIVPSTPQ